MSVNWVPIAELTDLAQALLGEGRGDRDVIPAHVRDRIVALAEQWAACGFTAETVGPWADLDPAAASLLVAAGFTPDALQRHVVAVRGGETSLWSALVSGALSAQEVVDRFQPPGMSDPTAAVPATPSAGSAPRPAPAVFSHPVDPLQPDDTDQRGRSTPQRTPFQL